jgi:hypothetical protein
MADYLQATIGASKAWAQAQPLKGRWVEYRDKLGEPIDLQNLAADIICNRLGEIAERIRKLPYGEYIELCNDVGIDAARLWNWSTKRE